ncbi:MAG: hypothetical protein ONB16_09835 [candidate division KSB1 bacterium]|nr:hypothetical protein [candidate division KSB1 bacterium]MDZ7318229.1 hypothetical protein [candidate division KSB1 bacterium]MDZ7341175.1 hypothetical protein [candidate division KSB1 bacterium]
MKALKPSLILLLGLLWLMPTRVASQATIQDTVLVDLQLFIPDNGIFYLNDLNLANLGSAPLLFAVTIHNYFLYPKDLVLHFGIRRGNEILIDGATEPFRINALERIYLTSQNILSEGQRYSIQNIEISDATESLRDAILARGKLPAGVYQFYVQVDYDKYNINQRVVIDEEDLIINAATVLDLIAPGWPADNADLVELYTPLPFFQWHSNATRFRITVCEKMPTNVSPPDVMNNEPRLQQIVENVTFFQYPPAGVWPLEEGKTYYWQIVAIIESSSGPVELASEIWAFKIANLSGGRLSLEHQQVLAYLQALAGELNIEELFAEGGPLYDFIFTGVMLNNNSPMSMNQLNALIQKILDKKITVDSFQVE